MDDSNDKPPYVYEIRNEVSRDTVAKQNRAVSDIKKALSEQEEAEMQALREQPSSDTEALSEAFNKFHQAKKQREELEEKIENVTSSFPPASSYRSELSFEQAKAIFHLYKSGLYTQQELANQYGISQGEVSKITRDRKYS